MGALTAKEGDDGLELHPVLGGLSLIALVALTVAYLRVRSHLRGVNENAVRTQRELGARLETEEHHVRQFRGKVAALKGAMERGGLRCVFQPIVELSSGEVIGTEALARFSDGRSPQVWFQEAAELDILSELEMAAIDRAFTYLDELSDGYLAINVSPETISYPTFLSFLMRPDIPSERVVVELTEHAVVENYATVRGVIDKLKRLGVKVAVDDVGAGFSTFRHVLQLQPDIVKLDRSLIQGIHEDNVRLSLVSSLVAVAERMNASVVAEGIETEDEVTALWSLGIEIGQGYLFMRPCEPPIPKIDWHPVRTVVLDEDDRTRSARTGHGRG